MRRRADAAAYARTMRAAIIAIYSSLVSKRVRDLAMPSPAGGTSPRYPQSETHSQIHNIY